MHMKKNVVFACLIGLVSMIAYANEKETTAEDRIKMAEAHEKMAACLRSDRPIDECHEELSESCTHMKGEKCPMKHHGKKHHK
jgi:Tfp pilus assembly protein PilV